MDALRRHLTEDDLILHAYGESGAEQESQMDGHLRGCASCREAFQELQDVLRLVDAATPPEPAPEFERVMWGRVRRELPARRARWTLRQLVPLGALSAAVALAVLVALPMWRHRPPAPVAVADAAATAPGHAANARERVLLTALNDHFTRTEMLLVELRNAPDSDTPEFDFERTTAGDLLASSRLYRATAEENGDASLAVMLEDLESVLVEVARSPEHVDRHDLASLRTRIDDDDLIFKVRAVTNAVRERQQSLLTKSE